MTAGLPSVQSLTFERFWTWIQGHPNCIIRVGSGDAVIYDHEDHHWYFYVEGHEYVVQMIRGKRSVAEVVIRGRDVAFVQSEPSEQKDEHFFDLCDEQQQVICYFVLSHAYDEAESRERPIHWN